MCHVMLFNTTGCCGAAYLWRRVPKLRNKEGKRISVEKKGGQKKIPVLTIVNCFLAFFFLLLPLLLVRAMVAKNIVRKSDLTDEATLKCKVVFPPCNKNGTFRGPFAFIDPSHVEEDRDPNNQGSKYAQDSDSAATRRPSSKYARRKPFPVFPRVNPRVYSRSGV
jgi:hypothetical protein